MKLGIRTDSHETRDSSHGTKHHGPQLDGVPPIGENELEFLMESPTKRKLRDPVRSDVKTVGCFSFRVLCFPLGNQSMISSNPKIAIYVECVNVDGKDPRWVFSSVKFSICIVNFKDVRKSLYQEDTHSFCAAAIDRGWPDLLSHSDITAESGWLNDSNQMCIRATVCLRQADTISMGSDYNTRKETGSIGLSNLGSTCYLNGLLQSYFHIGKLCEIVYGMDTRAESPPEGPNSPTGGTRMPLPLALQSVFLRMETSTEPVNCTDLIRAFGWDSVDAFTQHDVQELARILCDKLEEKLKGTSQDGAIQKLFQGTIENYIECIDVEYKSTRDEAFYDIPVNVRGLTNEPLISLENSLKEFVATETLEGDNAYDAGEKYGKQKAIKGMRFKSLPPVLSFQLKRFSFDYEKLDNVKLHDRFEFGTNLVIENTNYLLHTVLVHSGDVNSGHYYAFVRPHAHENQWYRFDDEQVSKCSEYAAVNDNFGGEDVYPYNYLLGTSGGAASKPSTRRQRIHSAYMLIYIRESDVGVILARPNVSEVRARVEVESRKIEDKRKLVEEAKQIVNIVVHSFGTDDGGDNNWVVCNFSTNPSSTVPVSNQLKVNRDLTVAGLAELINPTTSSSSNTALFYWHPSSGRLQLMPRAFIAGPSGGITTPRNNPQATGDVSAFFQTPLSEHDQTLDRYVREFLPTSNSDSSQQAELHVLPVVGDKYSAWTSSLDSSRISLIMVKYFCPVTKKILSFGPRPVTMYSTISTLIPFVQDQLKQQLVTETTDIDVSTAKWLVNTPVSLDDWLVFEQIVSPEISYDIRPIELVGGTFAQLVTGSLVIFQKNTIVEAETEEESDAEKEIVDFPTNSIAEYAAAITNKVLVKVFPVSLSDPLMVDGLLANGCYDKQSIVDVFAYSPCREMIMDARWTLKTVLEKVGVDARENDERVDIYDHYPSAMREGPIVVSDDEGGWGRKILACKSVMKTEQNYSWNLWVVIVPKMSLSVRIFSDQVVELGCCFLQIDRDFAGLDVKQLRVADLTRIALTKIAAPATTYRLVEVCKSEIVRIYGPEEIINLEAAVVNTDNVFYDHIRLEPMRMGRECRVAHVDKQTGEKFGYPFVVELDRESVVTSKQVRQIIQAKLNVGEKNLTSWRICSSVGHYLKDDDVVGDRILLEHVRHPNCEAVNRKDKQVVNSHQKALTIR